MPDVDITCQIDPDEINLDEVVETAFEAVCSLCTVDESMADRVRVAARLAKALDLPWPVGDGDDEDDECYGGCMGDGEEDSRPTP
jgi:hypothetical protein